MARKPVKRIIARNGTRPWSRVVSDCQSRDSIADSNATHTTASNIHHIIGFYWTEHVLGPTSIPWQQAYGHNRMNP